MTRTACLKVCSIRWFDPGFPWVERTGRRARRIEADLVTAVREARRKHGLSQTHLAQRMRSSQSRVATIETGDPSVSLDLIVRALFAAGATRRELQRALAGTA